MPACELSTSIACARVVRGSRSSGKATIARACSAAARAGSACGCSMPTSTVPSRMRSIAASGGGCTHSTRSAPSSAVAASSTSMAPAAA
jgi:hypothetical protein